jgi:hypothetical protein
MIKKIDFGKTPLDELHHIFKYTMPEELENKKARLFPSGNADNEVSTISIFLASLSAVKEYREELFSEIGITKLKARNATLCAFTELDNSATGDRPDGLIVITSGMHKPIIEWACFVEAKVKDNQINESQIEKYADFAKEIGINNIITISNHLVTNPKEAPIKIKRRSFNLYHWSWTYLKVTGSRLIRTEKVKDKDHVYLLQELRRYFDTHKNLKSYVSMGKDWKDSVNQIHPYSPEQKIEAHLLNNIVKSLKQEEKDISLQMTDRTDFHVELLVKGDREEEIEKMLQKSKVVTCNYVLNKDKKNTFTLEIDFIRQRIKCSTNITVNQGKAQAQTSALINMFQDIAATSHVVVNAYYIRKKCNNRNVALAQLIDEKRDGDFYSILDKGFGDDIKTFEIKTEDLLGKDFQSVKNFIIKVESIAYRFISQVMANNKKS